MYVPLLTIMSHYHPYQIEEIYALVFLLLEVVRTNFLAPTLDYFTNLYIISLLDLKVSNRFILCTVEVFFWAEKSNPPTQQKNEKKEKPCRKPPVAALESILDFFMDAIS